MMSANDIITKTRLTKFSRSSLYSAEKSSRYNKPSTAMLKRLAEITSDSNN